MFPQNRPCSTAAKCDKSIPNAHHHLAYDPPQSPPNKHGGPWQRLVLGPSLPPSLRSCHFQERCKSYRQLFDDATAPAPSEQAWPLSASRPTRAIHLGCDSECIEACRTRRQGASLAFPAPSRLHTPAVPPRPHPRIRPPESVASNRKAIH